MKFSKYIFAAYLDQHFDVLDVVLALGNKICHKFMEKGTSVGTDLADLLATRVIQVRQAVSDLDALHWLHRNSILAKTIKFIC